MYKIMNNEALVKQRLNRQAFTSTLEQLVDDRIAPYMQFYIPKPPQNYGKRVEFAVPTAPKALPRAKPVSFNTFASKFSKETGVPYKDALKSEEVKARWRHQTARTTDRPEQAVRRSDGDPGVDLGKEVKRRASEIKFIDERLNATSGEDINRELQRRRAELYVKDLSPKEAVLRERNRLYVQALNVREKELIRIGRSTYKVKMMSLALADKVIRLITDSQIKSFYDIQIGQPVQAIAPTYDSMRGIKAIEGDPGNELPFIVLETGILKFKNYEVGPFLANILKRKVPTVFSTQKQLRNEADLLKFLTLEGFRDIALNVGVEEADIPSLYTAVVRGAEFVKIRQENLEQRDPDRRHEELEIAESEPSTQTTQPSEIPSTSVDDERAIQALIDDERAIQALEEQQEEEQEREQTRSLLERLWENKPAYFKFDLKPITGETILQPGDLIKRKRDTRVLILVEKNPEDEKEWFVLAPDRVLGNKVKYVIGKGRAQLVIPNKEGRYQVDWDQVIVDDNKRMELLKDYQDPQTVAVKGSGFFSKLKSAWSGFKKLPVSDVIPATFITKIGESTFNAIKNPSEAGKAFSRNFTDSFTESVRNAQDHLGMGFDDPRLSMPKNISDRYKPRNTAEAILMGGAFTTEVLERFEEQWNPIIQRLASEGGLHYYHVTF